MNEETTYEGYKAASAIYDVLTELERTKRAEGESGSLILGIILAQQAVLLWGIKGLSQ